MKLSGDKFIHPPPKDAQSAIPKDAQSAIEGAKRRPKFIEE
jgi:hypothetical protein